MIGAPGPPAADVAPFSSYLASRLIVGRGVHPASPVADVPFPVAMCRGLQPVQGT